MKRFLIIAAALALFAALPVAAQTIGGPNLIHLSGTTIVPNVSTWTFGGSFSGLTSIANGGTNQASQTTNGVNFYDGTHITSGAALTFNGSVLGIGSGAAAWYDGVDSNGNFGVAATQSGGTITSPFFTLAGSGFVGINNKTPGQFLDVTGNINVAQNDSYMINGVSALYASTSNSDLALGSSAAATWMAATSTASNNVAVGKFALNTGPSTAGATNNTAIGVSSLASLTSGSSNTAVGFGALQTMTGNNNNTAVGYQAMTNSTASFSTAVGWASLTGGGGGSFDTAFGYQAMGNYSSSASNDTAMGFKALFGLTNGNQNVGVGYQNSTTITSGSNNTSIGDDTASTTQTGSNNITIGSDISGPQAAANGSNFLDIGNLIFGNSMTSHASSSPAGTFSIASSTNSYTAGFSMGTTNGVCHVEKAAGTATSYIYYYYTAAATQVISASSCTGSGTTTVIED